MVSINHARQLQSVQKLNTDRYIGAIGNSTCCCAITLVKNIFLSYGINCPLRYSHFIEAGYVPGHGITRQYSIKFLKNCGLKVTSIKRITRYNFEDKLNEVLNKNLACIDCPGHLYLITNKFNHLETVNLITEKLSKENPWHQDYYIRKADEYFKNNKTLYLAVNFATLDMKNDPSQYRLTTLLTVEDIIDNLAPENLFQIFSIRGFNFNLLDLKYSPCNTFGDIHKKYNYIVNNISQRSEFEVVYNEYLRIYRDLIFFQENNMRKLNYEILELLKHDIMGARAKTKLNNYRKNLFQPYSIESLIIERNGMSPRNKTLKHIISKRINWLKQN